MINRRPKAGEIDRTRAVMKIVEETLAEECQVDISNVVEECEGIRCPE